MYERIPESIARDLISWGKVPPIKRDQASVMFANIHNMKALHRLNPTEMVDILSKGLIVKKTLT